MRRHVGIIAGLLATGIAAALVFQHEKHPVGALGKNVEVRVLKVSAGTRHFYSEDRGWQRFALETLPDRLLNRLGILSSVFIRPDGMLVLWVTEADKKTREPIQPAIDFAFVQFSDGRWAKGVSTAIKSNVTQIEFPIYPRGDAEINVRVRQVGEEAVFKITNPNPVNLEQWNAKPLPLTNYSTTCGIILSGDAQYLSMQMRDRNAESVGWIQYRVEVRDTAGNVDKIVSNGGRIRDFAERTYQPGPLRITVRPREFISAGYLTNQAPGTIQEMELSERAARLGLEKLYFLGKAEYLFRNGTPTLHSGTPLGANVLMGVTNSAGQWDAHLAARQPSLVAIYPVAAKVEGFDSRLRERTRRGNGGAIFEMYRPPYESRSMAPVHVLRQFELPVTSTTNAVEAEIIVRHPSVEFVVDRDG